MDRRTFIASAAALTLAPSVLLAATGQPYKKGLVGSELKAGKTVFLDFYTDWCTTCRAQAAAIEKLKSSNPAYEQAISFIAVDWDQHANSDLARNLNIPRRSTLVAIKGQTELGRIVAGTSEKDIKALMDKALGAATA